MDIDSFRKCLLTFFDAERRDLPWRAMSDPYSVWVSEVMLQQTRVETVKPYFRRWMKRFPTVEALAEADEDEVLKEWEGLGYYSRARNLHRAVREVVGGYGGRVPDGPEELRALPGVGPYTAGAVASIAFGRAVPAIDGNARRVLSRLFDEPEPRPAWLEERGSELVDPRRPGDFNQALMELGSLVCRPRAPDCESCPVAEACAALAAGTQEDRPARRAGREVPLVREVVVVLAAEERAGGRPMVRVRKRPPRGLLAGMWELPGRRIGDRDDGRGAVVQLTRELVDEAWTVGAHRSNRPSTAANDGAIFGEPVELEPLDHAFSHLRVRYVPHLVRAMVVAEPRSPSGTQREGGETVEEERISGRGESAWVGRGGANELALPAAQRILIERGFDLIESPPSVL